MSLSPSESPSTRSPFCDPLVVAWLAVGAVGLCWLAGTLPPNAFFAGDSGLKLIAAMNAIAHPWRPFEIDLPVVGGQAVPAVEQMMFLHAGHAHVVQSPLFPLLSAPLVWLAGLRGAYVIPALGFLAMIPLLDAVRRSTIPQASAALLACLVVTANPAFFYALEFWEHAPAIAGLCASTALAMAAGAPRAGSRSSYAMPLAGAVAGVAILLRPEAVWYVAGLAAAVGLRRSVPLACGAAAVAAPYALANALHFGNIFGPHLSVSLSPLQHNWIAERIQRIDAWLIPGSMASASGLLLILASHALGIVRVALAPRQLIALAGAALVALAAGFGWFDRDSLWRACPIAALALVPSGRSRSLNAMWLVVLVCSAGILLSATNDGGAQWGPRFLLIATPTVMVIAASTCTGVLAAGGARLGRRVLIALVMLGCLATTRLAYRELRGSKQMYARLVAATESFTRPEAPLVFNVWWFDQVTASLYGNRTFLYARSPSEASNLLRALSSAGISSATLVWTDEPDGQSLATSVTGTCFQLEDVEKVSVRAMTLASVRCQ